MQLRFKTIQLRIDLLLLLFPVLAVLLGSRIEVVCLTLALLIHELAHIIAAKLLKIGMSSVRLTPFGGLAQIENPYAVSPARLFALSAAGPTANLLAMLIASSLGRWLPASPESIALFLRINAMLMLFNLLPALPLDGGRMLFAVLSTILRRERALAVGIWGGRILATLLILIALWGIFARQRLNLSPLFTAVFLLSSASDERQALLDSRVQTLINSLRPLEAPVPAQIMAIDAAVPPAAALSAARPDRITLFAVYQDGRLDHLTDDRTLLARVSETKEAQK